MNEDLIAKMQEAVAALPEERVASFHARFLAYVDAGLADDLRAAGDVSFGDFDALALQRVWRERKA